MRESRVLICAEEPEVSDQLATEVKSFGYSVHLCHYGDESISLLQNSEAPFFAVFLDVLMPNRDFLEILRAIRARDAKLAIIIVAGLWSARDVVAALKSGATDFLCKPIIRDELAGVLNSAIETGDVVCKSAPRHVKSPWAFGSANPQVREIESLVSKIGWSDVPVLIQGETGSGKEVLARKLHAESARPGPRSRQPNQ